MHFSSTKKVVFILHIDSILNIISYIKMSNNHSQRGRFNGLGRGNDRGGGFLGQRHSGRFNNRYHNSQNRSSVPPRDDEDEFMFEIHPNRIDTVKFINAQR